MNSSRKYDVALSFAGEDRAFVDQVANLLRDKGVKVFYDLLAEADLWGKDLYEFLTDVYQNQAKFTIMFISAAYGEKRWTNHERKAAQARAFQEHQEYILPVRFDDTDIPGILSTTGYISLEDKSPEDLVSLITKKLVSSGGAVPSDFVRGDFSTIQKAPRPSSAPFSVNLVDDENNPVCDGTVVALADNGTTKQANSGADGIAVLSIQVRRLYRILVAHPDFPAAFVEHVDPVESLEIVLPRAENLGSLVIHSTGYIPGINGRLNPIQDASNRTYLYADNIAIDGGKPQPATFRINEPFRLEDADGNITFVTVKLSHRQTFLLQYLRPA